MVNNNTSDLDSEERLTTYLIPNPNEPNEIAYKKFILDNFNQKFDDTIVIKRAEQVKGCKIIYHNGKFITLLDQAYRSYLLGMNYSTVCLCSLANERLIYDLMDGAIININNKVLNPIHKEALYDLRFSGLLQLCMDCDLITKQIFDWMIWINGLRNRYVHPSFKETSGTRKGISPEKDAIDSLNKLIKIINKVFN